MTGPRILTLDLETAPTDVAVFGLFNQNVSLPQIQAVGGVISFAAKWHDKPQVMFYSDFHHGHDVMVQKAHSLLSETDVLVTYNGDGFDIPHLNREFLMAGITPPAPFKSVDLYKVAKRRFRFISNKLEHIAGVLDVGTKLKHEGFDMWMKCMAGDEKAWSTMRRYNKHDVVITEGVYDALLPWIDNHPHHGLYIDSESPVCPNCGSDRLQKRGTEKTVTRVYQRYACQNCGHWGRSVKSLGGVSVR